MHANKLNFHLQQATFLKEQVLDGTHKLAEPVSNTTWKCWAGVPIDIGP